MALAWTLRDPRLTSTLVGASSVEQLEQNIAALDQLDFDADELAEIELSVPSSRSRRAGASCQMAHEAR
jgi:aryl-alcohol dehydrogenase-like predicted oxidoreductase